MYSPAVMTSYLGGRSGETQLGIGFSMLLVRLSRYRGKKIKGEEYLNFNVVVCSEKQRDGISTNPASVDRAVHGRLENAV